MKKRVAVIGAGPSGLSVLRAFQSAAEKGSAEMPEIICYEKQSDWGGLWNYSWQTGVGHDGEPVHSGMYRNLWSNGPKECLEFADYSFAEHFGKAIGSFPPRPVVADYIKARAEKSGMRERVRFSSPVRIVTYSDETEKFTVTFHDRTEDHICSHEFDHVVVATGHFSVPNVPQFEGLSCFNGRILHSHEFRDASQFRDQNVLIIGRSYSAEDIGSQCYKFGAKSITLSYRSKPTGIKWPQEKWKEVPLLERVDTNGKTCHFRDKSKLDVDAIILCTGYRHDFPFLADDLRLKTDNRIWPLGLYEGVVWERNPKLSYVGMQDQFFTFTMFDAQAWYLRDVILGSKELPSRDEMAEHSRKWRELEDRAVELDDPLECMALQANYIKELVEQTDYPLSREMIEEQEQHFRDWEHHKTEDIMAYRDHEFRSVVTGTMAKQFPTSWLQAFEDSLESYLAACAL
ncbi:hypothetical protein Mapa_002636 [Marchantia paleacea]|nr:hypothetical protein Mapa_002636 [Marchantia paleacea]